MKKLMTLLMMCALVASTFAGGKKQEPSSSSQPTPSASASQPAATAPALKVGFVYIGTINDEGYTQAHDKGRLAVEALGVETAYIENVAANADCEKAIRDLIDQGCNLIYTNSFGFMDWTIKVAKEFPNVKFAHCSGYQTAPNVSTYFGKIYQARYLSGIAAGRKSATGAIGYVAAFSIPEVIRGINAFTLGVQSVNPNATVEVIWTNTWFDPAVEKQAALELLNKGCDVIAQHQDTASPQLAAQEKGAFAVGYNVATPNAAPLAYLTAPVFHWEVFYVDDVKSALAGTWKSRAYWEGLSSGIVSLDTLTQLNDPATANMIDEAANEITSGVSDPFMGPLFDQNNVERVADGVRMSDTEIWNMGWFVQGVIGTILE
ncbi:MAG: BMP family ABC transporter substrate-binding protein [Treponema sp.]|jgi:basic membrane protein A|nr:BMP family ABC transporter substrate-binding protein [Treponema sp.]